MGYGEPGLAGKAALEEFGRIKMQYPVKLMEQPFTDGSLNWDFDMVFYLTDISADLISLAQR